MVITPLTTFNIIVYTTSAVLSISMLLLVLWQSRRSVDNWLLIANLFTLATFNSFGASLRLLLPADLYDPAITGTPFLIAAMGVLFAWNTLAWFALITHLAGLWERVNWRRLLWFSSVMILIALPTLAQMGYIILDFHIVEDIRYQIEYTTFGIGLLSGVQMLRIWGLWMIWRTPLRQQSDLLAAGVVSVSTTLLTIIPQTGATPIGALGLTLTGILLTRHLIQTKLFYPLVEANANLQTALATLRLSEEKFSKIFQNSPDSVIVSSIQDGRYVDVNQVFSQLTGYTREEVVGKTSVELNIWPSAAERQRFIETLQREGRVHNFETAYRAKDGGMIPAILSSDVVQIGGKPHLLTVSKDIINIKRLMNELEEAKTAAEDANRAKSAFLTNMSHELRTPLNAILGFSQLLQIDSALTDKHHQYINLIYKNGQHLLTLISDILELSKIEAGRMELTLVEFDLRELLDTIQAVFDAQAQMKGLVFRMELDDIAYYRMVGDERKIRQILFNLLGNAIKFTSHGEIRLKVAQEVAENQIRLRFTVRDSGSGIAPDELDKLFAPFSQTASGRNTQSGTGLGLAISQQFAQLMGGKITVESLPEQGSTFSVMLMVEPAAGIARQTSEWVAYRSGEDDDSETANSSRPLTAAMGALPTDLRARLRQVAVSLDVTEAGEVIEQVQRHDPALAERIAQWVRDFNFDRLQTALNAAEQTHFSD